MVLPWRITITVPAKRSAAYNSADAGELERYNARYGRKTPPQDWIDMYAMTGRLTPVRVQAAGPNNIVILLSAEHGDRFWESKAKIDPADSMKILEAQLGPAERPPEFAIPRLPRAELNRDDGSATGAGRSRINAEPILSRSKLERCTGSVVGKRTQEIIAHLQRVGIIVRRSMQ
jgi:hypothetical protein